MRILLTLLALAPLAAQDKLSNGATIQATATVVIASQIPGFVNDHCRPFLRTTPTGGACTDNSIVLSNVALTASATKPLKLIIDTTTAAAIRIPSCGNIEIVGNGWGTGIIVPQNSDATGISNSGTGLPYWGNVSGSPPAVAAGCGNVIVHHMILDGNRSGTGSGYVSPGNAANGVVSGNILSSPHSYGYDSGGGLWFMGINLYNMANIIIDDVYFWDIPAYSIYVSNVNGLWLTNCLFDGKTYAAFQHQDGIHMGGYTSDVHSVGNIFRNLADDNHALNAPEVYAGPISNVTISLNEFTNADSCLFGYAGNDASQTITGVIFDHNQCNYVNFGVVMGFVTGSTSQAEQWKDLLSTGNKFTPTTTQPPFWIGNIGIRDLQIVDDTLTTGFATPFLMEATDRTGGAITNLDMSVVIQRTANVATPLFYANNTIAIGKARVSKFAVQDPTGTSYTAVPEVVSVSGSGTIGELYFAPNIFADNITANWDTLTGITKVAGYLPVPLAVASLPTGVAPKTCGWVNNALAPAYGTTAVGGGSVYTPVCWETTSSTWKAH